MLNLYIVELLQQECLSFLKQIKQKYIRYLDKPLHIIQLNLRYVMNCVYCVFVIIAMLLLTITKL